MLRRFALAVLLSMCGASAMRAQAGMTPPAALAASAPSVTLITFGSGGEVFERFGHNALWFHDPLTMQDVAYHWGLFSFNEPGFLLRFLTGDTKYWMGAVDARALIAAEQGRGRPITLQHLNLTPDQARKLQEFVHWNERPENRFYRYDYFADNCSTRLRDALDGVIGGAIRRASDSITTALSYRSESVRLTAGDRPVQLGIDIALGRPADVPLTEWQSFFIPMRLRDAVRTIRIAGPNGTTVPLVADEQAVPLPPEAVAVPELPTAPRLAPRYLLLGVFLAVLVVGLRIMMLSRRSAAWGLALFGSAWSLLCGLLGVILTLAWVATKHVFWAWNENLLLLTPISLVLVFLIPVALLSARHERAARMTATLVAVLGLVALLLAVVPGGQENRAIVALLLPVHLAFAWALALPRGRVSPAG
ncbi:MAG: DUF4105 domain-containing protein [Gemmatimonadota bacterium]|nr:DUF4105 domain-containing protein [Gemmatimonadota bacterium]